MSSINPDWCDPTATLARLHLQNAAELRDTAIYGAFLQKLEPSRPQTMWMRMLCGFRSPWAQSFPCTATKSWTMSLKACSSSMNGHNNILLPDLCTVIFYYLVYLYKIMISCLHHQNIYSLCSPILFQQLHWQQRWLGVPGHEIWSDLHSPSGMHCCKEFLVC